VCFACRRLGFVVSSPTPETESDEENEELPQPQQLDRPTPRMKLTPRPKTIVHLAPSHDDIPAFVAFSVFAMRLSPLSESGSPYSAEDDESPPLTWDKIAFEMLGESALDSSRHGVRDLY
ncbi:hypothetical protein K456DRAFT_1828603, partial [Colletotrichum gloeosporioides 23]